MNHTFTHRVLAALTLACLFALCALPASAQGPVSYPPTWVYARAYGAWSIVSQSANTYTFNGLSCNFTPFNNGQSSSFFAFSGSQGSTAVYNPVFIQDANPALNEIVTPSSTPQGSGACGFAASTANSHISFTLSSGSGGLQEAISAQSQSPFPIQVVLDPFWYNLVYSFPINTTTPLTPESIIKATTGNVNVTIVDTTSSPYTFWRWSGSAYAAVSLTGGTTLPTYAAGAAAGTSPTLAHSGDANTYIASLTTGTATTTGTLFTLVWPSSASFTYPPSCRVWSTGANAFTSFTSATTFASSQATLTVTVTAVPTASTAYKFAVVCE